MTANEVPPAGWHPDPEQPNTWRYWDGQNWTEQRAPMQTAPAAASTTTDRGSGPRHWRKMTWVLIIWSALILVWAIAGGGSAANDCSNETTRSLQNACDAGTGLGILVILLIGFFGFAFFSLIWFMTRPRG